MLSRITKTALILCLCFAAQAQTPVFEVASIKPATPQGPLGMRANRRGGPGTNDPGMYTCENCPLYWVVSEAYDLQPFEYAGPDWLQNVRFDFSAKIPAGASKEALRIMLQNLLAERFKLAVHREKKAMTVFEMTAVKNGPKFHESVHKDAPPDSAPPGRLQQDRDGFPVLAGSMTMAISSGHARLRSADQPMAWLTRMLAGQLHGPVIDATGLSAKYEYTLSWAFDDSNNADAQDSFRVSLRDALQTQLGLKLEQKKGQAEVLLIDRMEKTPTAN